MQPHERSHADSANEWSNTDTKLKHQVDNDEKVVQTSRRESVRWWISLFAQPVLIVAVGVMFVVLIGVSQRFGILPSSMHSASSSHQHGEAKDVRYICPMMCTPPQSEPGRCPVCAMELVPATAKKDGADDGSIQIDSVARRVASIQTVSVVSKPMMRVIKAIGELHYDEGTLRTISAYVDGRLDRLYADYTGIKVNKGDHLALIYSPKLYSSQIELLLAKKSWEESRGSTLSRVASSNKNLYQSARQRLIEQGMTEDQVLELEKNGEANSRLRLCAPTSGTVIEKSALEGDYVKEGQPICKLADLSTVWLKLKLFPEDAAMVRFGQKVEAKVQSLPGRQFTGRVAFVDPNVDPKTRTVGVRVVIPNDRGLLKIGDFARATINVPISNLEPLDHDIYDPELADKWISPKHPHIVQSEKGNCPVCGIDLIPASELGFTSLPSMKTTVLVVPSDAVLSAGEHSVVYVETKPGRFELRPVVVGPSSGDEVAILDGLAEGDQVATKGSFLIDSQMQLAGNPSLIDPTKYEPTKSDAVSEEMLAALSKLSMKDQESAKRQKVCPVTKMALGSMGTPPKVDVEGQTIFLCCKGCEAPLLENPKKYLAQLGEHPPADNIDPEILDALSKLSESDRKLARRQHICPVGDAALGSMGPPIKVNVKGRPVFICCEGCRESLQSEPDKYLHKIDEYIKKSDSAPTSLPSLDSSDQEDFNQGLPPISTPIMIIESDASGN